MCVATKCVEMMQTFLGVLRLTPHLDVVWGATYMAELG